MKSKKRGLKLLIVVTLSLAILIFSVFEISMLLWVDGDMHSDIPLPPPRFTSVEFTSDDGLTLSGWIRITDACRGGVVLAHGVAANRMMMLEQAEFLAENGWSVLLFDFRNHGSSGKAHTTYGWMERRDVAAAARYLSNAIGAEKLIVACGISLGAASSIMAAAIEPKIKAVIAEAPYDSISNTFVLHGRLMFGRIAGPAVWMVAELLAFIAGFSTSDVSALDAAAECRNKPILFVVGKNDVRTPPEVVSSIASAHGGLQRLWIANGEHATVWRDDGEAYRRILGEFLSGIADDFKYR